MKLIAFTLYMLTVSLWIGGVALFTFVITPLIFRGFSRDTAAAIVDKFFNAYFLYNFALSIFAMLLYLVSRQVWSGSGFKASIILLIFAVLINSYVAFKLHPDILVIKRQVKSFESAPKDDPLRRKFGRLHAVSAVLNLMVFADGVALLVIENYFRGR
jgi:hypothetical protein